MAKPISLMTPEERAEWADDHGYSHRHCNRCGKNFWTDSNEPCPNGCYDGEDDDEAT